MLRPSQHSEIIRGILFKGGGRYFASWCKTKLRDFLSRRGNPGSSPGNEGSPATVGASADIEPSVVYLDIIAMIVDIRILFSMDWGGGQRVKSMVPILKVPSNQIKVYSRYHQNPDEIRFLSSFDPFSYHHWG